MLKSFKARLRNQPYLLFLLTAVVLIIASFFRFGQSVDIHLHDTYLVIDVNYFIWALAVLFLIAWVIYKLTEKLLWTKKLTWTHVLLTILVLILLSTIVLWHNKILPPIKRDVISYQDIIDDQKREKIIAYPIMIVFVSGQIAYFINLIVGLIKKVAAQEAPF